jgi:hypothetical protein
MQLTVKWPSALPRFGLPVSGLQPPHALHCMDTRTRRAPRPSRDDTVFASTGVTHRNTYEEFEKVVGKTNAEAALRRYYREQDAA